jgi:nitrogen fixation protein NifB
MEQSIEKKSDQKFRVAVASYEGALVNQHLGMAESLLVFEVDAEGCRFIERRRTPRPGTGDERWQALARRTASGRSPFSDGHKGV